jgi:hypothetical protein
VNSAPETFALETDDSRAVHGTVRPLVRHSLASGVGEQVVYTPDDLAAGIVGHFRPAGRVCEPCKGGGAFLRAMPGADWFEIAEGRDFLTAAGRWDWIVTNPPWRELGPFLDKAMTCADNVVFLAWASAWWSKARQRKIEAAGFGMAEMLLCPTPPKPWPQSGFLLGAVWLRRGWQGSMAISRTPGLTGRRKRDDN